MPAAQKEIQPQSVNQNEVEPTAPIRQLEHDNLNFEQNMKQHGGQVPPSQQMLDHLLIDVMDAEPDKIDITVPINEQEKTAVPRKKKSLNERISEQLNDLKQQIVRTFQRRPDQTVASKVLEEQKREYAEAKDQILPEDSTTAKSAENTPKDNTINLNPPHAVASSPNDNLSQTPQVETQPAAQKLAA